MHRLLYISHQSRTFVTINRLPLMYRNHPKTIVWQFALDIVHPMSFVKLLKPCIYHYSITCSTFSAVKILCVLSIYPSHHQSLATTDCFTLSIVLLFSDCHIIGTIDSVAFSYWHLSLSNIYLSFLHVFSWIDSSFLIRAE